MKNLNMLGMAIVLSICATAAQASDFKTSMEQIWGYIRSLGQVAIMIIIVVGVLCFVTSIMKFWACRQNPTDPSNKVLTAIIYFFIGVGLIGFGIWVL